MISTNIGGAAVYAALQAAPAAGSAGSLGPAASFSGALEAAMTKLPELGREADAKAVQALSGDGNLTDMVMAVSKAEMALQATVAVRDKMISAYQDIMRMAV